MRARTTFIIASVVAAAISNCGGDSSTSDGGSDASTNDVTVPDTGTSDTGTDTGAPDTGSDAGGDATVADSGTDTGSDAVADTGSDAVDDTGADAVADAGTDAVADAGASDASTTVANVAAYVWANNSTSASYTPSTSYSYNSAGGAITITRSSTGTYSVTFGNLSINSGDVQVSAYGSSAHCNVTSWGGSSVSVACYAPNGTAVDSDYTVLVVLNDTTTVADPVAYAWASQPTTASYTASASYAYNAGGGAITATRSATGKYAMAFAGLNLGGGDVQVSAYNSSANCEVASWSSTTANIQCYDNAGSLVDSNYAVLLMANNVTSTATLLGYAWANNSTSASYTPSTSYSFNSSGQAITATRSAAGSYAITFAGLAAIGNVKVSAYSSSELCNVSSWSNTTANVRCYDASNTLTDTRYTVLVTK